jgi:hypothetical protein
MRYLMLPVTVMAIALSMPALASKKQSDKAATPTFDDCYRLGWVRGVHIELGEFPGWYEECKAGKIPFDSGNPATSIRPSDN